MLQPLIKKKEKSNEDKLKEIAEIKEKIAGTKSKEEVPEAAEDEAEESAEETSEEAPEIEAKQKERIMVVKELPVQSFRSYTDEDGTKVNLVTVEEALSEILNS